MRQTALSVLAVVLLALGTSPAWAVVAPLTTPADFTGDWAGTNWSMDTVGVFQWMAGSAVAISPYQFLTARHLNTAQGQITNINGVSVTVLDVKIVNNPGEGGPGSDMNLVTVDRPLPVAEWETLYNGTYATSTDFIMIGYGYGGHAGPLGYNWDYSIPRAKRWGTNRYYMSLMLGDSVNTYTHGFAMPYSAGDTNTQYEAGYSDGDSGGGTFVKVGDRWKLAGINLEVSGAYPAYTGSYAGDVSHYYNWIIDNTTIPGDANIDLKVSFADYLALEANFGRSGASWDMGDFNHDGKVSFADYLLLEANFGKSAIPPGATILPPPLEGGGQVPEPATMGLLIGGAVAILRRK